MRTTLRFWYGFFELCIAHESPNAAVMYKWVSSQVAPELYACIAGHVILLVKLTCFIKSSVCAWLYRVSSQCDKPLFQHTIYYLSNHYIRLLLWTTIVTTSRPLLFWTHVYPTTLQVNIRKRDKVQLARFPNGLRSPALTYISPRLI